MSAHRTTARFALATALVAALCLGGSALAASAAGEPDGLYSATDGEGGSGFVQLSKTDATATALGAGTDLYTFFSVEVVNGLGYATGVAYGADDDSSADDTYMFFTWDITTGEVLSAVPLSSTAGPIGGITALDTTPSGLFLLYVEFGGDGEGVPSSEWIASIDPATGAVTLLVNVDLPDDGRIFEGIATNPVTGITYALADYDNGVPAYSPVDLAAGTVGASVALTSISDSIGAGWFVEGDFDATGVLWFIYSSEVGVARTDAPAEVGVEATELGDPDIEDKAITVGQTVVPPAPEPQLAATGLSVAPVAGIAAVLLAAGALVVFGRRRSAA